MPQAQRQGSANLALKKVLIDRDAIIIDQPHANFGLGIVKTNAQKTLPMILYLNHVPIGSLRG